MAFRQGIEEVSCRLANPATELSLGAGLGAHSDSLDFRECVNGRLPDVRATYERREDVRQRAWRSRRDSL